MTRLDPDRQERWILSRGQGYPVVYPFRSREEAEVWAVDHAMIDWQAERSDDPEKEHEEFCVSCREPWPCATVRLDREAQRIIWAAKSECHRCGKRATWTVKVPGGGHIGEDVVYHARKGACRTLARKELTRLGHVALLAKFDEDLRQHEEHLARSRAWRAAHKEAIALGLSRDDAYRHRAAAMVRYEQQGGARP